MNELRKDYLLERFAIIAENRGKRPQDFAQGRRKTGEEACVFCPGNEHMTPPETDRVSGDSGWLLRSFYNKFPAVSREFPRAFGVHEVLVETPIHGKPFYKFRKEEVAASFRFYARRVRALYGEPGIRYVSIFKNEGEKAGCSLVHTHSQLIALGEIPRLVGEELRAFEAERMASGRCVFCDVVERERTSERLICEDEHFISIAPYASRSPFEVWFIPKRHAAGITDLSTEELDSLGSQLSHVLKALVGLTNSADYNYWLHTAPNGKDFHFHVELMPRLSIWAGFELSNELYINTMPPEKVARALKGQIINMK